MHKDYRPVLRKDDVWPAWQVLAMQPKPKAGRMKVPADNQFGLGILALDSPHVFGADKDGMNVRHVAAALVSCTFADLLAFGTIAGMVCSACAFLAARM